MFRTILTGALALSAALAMSASVQAASLVVNSDNDDNVVTLRITDADLHTAHGAKELASRIRVAADRACSAERLAAAVEGVDRECREAAINRAIKDLNAPLLAAALGRSPQVVARSGR